MVKYADLGHLRMAYEQHGKGDPLVLLHGGLGGALVWAQQVPAFAGDYEVFIPEQRGRARTHDLPGELTYQVLVDDMVAFLD